MVVILVFWFHEFYSLLRYLVRYNLNFQLNLIREALTAKLHSEIILKFILKFVFDIIEFAFLFSPVPIDLIGSARVLLCAQIFRGLFLHAAAAAASWSIVFLFFLLAESLDQNS
jgi:hypothetical protein